MQKKQNHQLRLKSFSERTLLWVTLFVLLLSSAAAAEMTEQVRAEAMSAAPVHKFERVEAEAGWVWHGDDLDWSDDGGVTWRRITPGDADAYRLAGVQFANAEEGWALLARRSPGTPNEAARVLARTADAGITWQFSALPEAVAATLAAAKAVHLLPVGATQGFVAAEQATSSNFSRGELWYTEDSGVTWQERTLPLGEAVQFVDAHTGWLAGGPQGDALWRTADGGLTWQEQALPRKAAAGERLQVYTPLAAADGSLLVLPLLARGEAGQAAEWYSSRDRGATWELGGRQGVHATSGMVEAAESSAAAGDLARQDARAFLAAQIGAPVPPVESLPFFANTALENGSRLMQVKMATAVEGWALAVDLQHHTSLLGTYDGGQRWQPLMLPAPSQQGEPEQEEQMLPIAAAGAGETVERTTIARGPGFDICNLPAVGELATWYAASPYRSVNLYIGGVLRFCKNEDLSAAKLAELAAQGWTFMPTWVGPQAPCTSYRSRFSSDPGEAYREGAAEAQAALAVAETLGLAEQGGRGTIVYYDLEAYDGTDQGCVSAAQAFVSGWSSTLRARGSQSGLYSSACNPPMGRYASSAAPPDAIWMAAWNREAFDPNMTVWNISCIDNSLWARSQRIRQYTNSHDETWGGVTLEIDSNVLDSIVADMDAGPVTPAPTPTPAATPTPQPMALAETPKLDPGYDNGMCGAGWHLVVNERGFPAYLAANRAHNGTIPPGQTELRARWELEIPADGLYRVEAYIPSHAAVQWLCPQTVLAQDTKSAQYEVEHANGTTRKVGDQAAANGRWLLLGVYPFRMGLPAVVTLATATREEAYTRTVAASALRATRLENGVPGSEFLYLPLIDRR